MLERESVALHNVVELRERAGMPGAQLLRLPSGVLSTLTARMGRWVAQDAVNCELRFVTESPFVRVTVMSRGADGRAFVSLGDYAHSAHALPAGAVTTLHLERSAPIADAPAEFLPAGRFSPDVWRITFDRTAMHFVEVETFDFPVRPPRPDELPRLTWLAYGSSITHSAAYHGYPAHTARNLGVDLLNLGLSGSCHAEPEVAEYIAGRDDWHFATFELGINMRAHFTPEEYAAQVRRFVTTVVERNPAKPVFLITVYPNHMTFRPGTQEYEREHAYNRTLRELAAEMASAGRRVHLIEGTEVLDTLAGLSVDLLHPSEHGHVRMGANLARLLAPHVADLPGRPGGRG